MKIFYLGIVILSFHSFTFSQTTTNKPAVDTSLFHKWPHLKSPKISINGKYVAFTINNQPIGQSTLIIRDTSNSWHLEFQGAHSAFCEFSQDEKTLIFMNKDSIVIVSLGTNDVSYIANVSTFKFKDDSKNKWLAYQLYLPSETMVLQNLTTGEKQQYNVVADDFWFLGENKLLVNAFLKNKKKALQLISFETVCNIISDTLSADVRNVVIDNENNQVAFIQTRGINNNTIRTLCHYKLGMSQAIELYNDSMLVNDSNLTLSSVRKFSNDGTLIFLTVNKKEILKENTNKVQVDVWSYLDPRLQSVQINAGKRNFGVVFNIETKRLMIIEDDNTRNLGEDKNNYTLVYRNNGGSEYERHWNKLSNYSIHLVSFFKETSKPLKTSRSPNSYRISSCEKFVVFYDPDKKNYFSYEISSGIYRNITKTIKTKWCDNKWELPVDPQIPFGIAGFVTGDESVLLYDYNDIYLVDLKANRPVIELTHNQGKKNKLIFRYAFEDNGVRLFGRNQKIILNALNTVTKDNGFYSITLNEECNLTKLTMQPAIFIGGFADEFLKEEPVKSANAEVFVVRKMKANESSNYFITTDFKSFRPITNIHPERNYNWYTTELYTWKTFDGTISQGILYKPENFNSQKKYPLIFFIYESRLSEGLNGCYYPEPSKGALNILQYVSDGYLVFVPDIHYKIGYPGKSAYNTVISAAQILTKNTWVDSTKMGLQGHSFGGYETLYIITHTNIFAAAVACAGVSDFISAYGSLRGNGESRQWVYEVEQSRLKYTLWEKPELYIENSPILRAHKVKTPVLMNNNISDAAVPFAQGVEFFCALRRLGKRAWMLQYDDEVHVLDVNAALDFTIRMKQFFDHYLKSLAPPIWMTKGIPNSRKGIDYGFELDPHTKTPGEGLLINRTDKVN